VVNENFNEGWQARIDGGDSPLEPVRLEGWKQAWVLPEGSAGTVTLTYTPDALYHRVLAAGGALAALLVVLALWPRRWLPGWTRLRTGPPRRSRALPDAGPAWLARWAVLPLGVVYGVWIAGWAGAAVVGVILLALWWLARRAPRRLRHAKPGSPSMGGRALPHLAGPWVVTVSLALAGLASATGTYLAVNMPFHDITETVGTALRGWVPQALCLPAMARLVLALGQRGAEHEPPGPGDPPEPARVALDEDLDEDRGRRGPPAAHDRGPGGAAGRGHGHGPESGHDPGPESGHDVQEAPR
jgi:arabinofuranan 3-O-arabinosyltransferase